MIILRPKYSKMFIQHLGGAGGEYCLSLGIWGHFEKQFISDIICNHSFTIEPLQQGWLLPRPSHYLIFPSWIAKAVASPYCHFVTNYFFSTVFNDISLFREKF